MELARRFGPVQVFQRIYEKYKLNVDADAGVAMVHGSLMFWVVENKRDEADGMDMTVGFVVSYYRVLKSKSGRL